MFLCVLWFPITKQIRISVRLYGVWYNTCNCLTERFLSNNFFIINPVNSNLRVCLQVKNSEKKRKWWKPSPITGLEETTSVITDQCLYHCAASADMLAYPSVTIHNIIYLFNINSRKQVGHYRSWTEYLNERY